MWDFIESREKSPRQIESLFKDLYGYLSMKGFLGWDPYDFLKTRWGFLRATRGDILLILTQLNRISPINLRKVLRIDKGDNPKAISLIVSALLNYDSLEFDRDVQLLVRRLIQKKSKEFEEYSIGFGYDVKLSHYFSSGEEPSLIISLFAVFAFIRYYNINHSEEIGRLILSFYGLLNKHVPRVSEKQEEWYSYNFDKINEIYNATAKIGRFYSEIYHIFNDGTIEGKIRRILNYIKCKQRPDGSWAYGANISYTDGFHTAFMLDSIWHMKRIVNDRSVEEMFQIGMEHYKRYLFTRNWQPLHFHPNYPPRDIRRLLIETDIRDCAMAIVLFSKLGAIKEAGEVLKWTLQNMYDSNKHYYYFFKAKYWRNRIEFIRPQAWMLYALSEYKKALER